MLYFASQKIYLFLNDKKMEEDIFKIFTKNKMIVEYSRENFV